MSCKCHSCKKQYTTDLIIPDDIWVMVYREDHAKAKDGGGLLCPHCIIDRIQDVCTFSVMMLTIQRTTKIKENEMTTTFELACVGDRVWSLRLGWGEIISMRNGLNYPLLVKFSGTTCSFTVDGRENLHMPRYLFWDEVVIEAPTKPLPDLAVDTKVIVWSDTTPKTKRHFSHFSPSGEMMCFVNGMTSWTTSVTSGWWENWELAE